MSSVAFLWPAIAGAITGAALYATRGVLDQTVTANGIVRIAMLPSWQSLLGFIGLASLILVGIDHLNTPRGTTTNRESISGRAVMSTQSFSNCVTGKTSSWPWPHRFFTSLIVT